MKSVLITGTDTGIGKTFVSCLLAREFKSRGLRVGVFKPVETGAKGPPEDACKLKEASGCAEPIETVCPYVFKTPVAPWAASRVENRPIFFPVIQSAFETLANRHDITLVESAGGLLVPISQEGTYADLAARLHLPLIIVVGLRLGAINQALLTFEAAQARRLRILGYILNEFEPDESPGAKTVQSALLEFSRVPFLGKVGYRADSLFVDEIFNKLDIEIPAKTS